MKTTNETMRERFEKEYPWDMNRFDYDEMIAFIESEISRAVADREEEIVDAIIVEQACYGSHEPEHKILQEIINSIKNKTV